MNEPMLDEDDAIRCDECEHEVYSDDDLYPYEDINVCLRCYDKLKRQDEQDVIRWETEESSDYDY